MSTWDFKKILNPGGVSVDTDTAATTVVLGYGKRVAVSRLSFVTTEVQTGTASVLTLVKRKVDDTGSVTLGTFSIPTSGSALNKLFFVDLIKPSATGAAGADSTTQLPTTVFTTSGKGPVYIEADEELAITSDGVSTAGIYQTYVEGWEEGYNEKAVAPATTEVAFTAA